MHIRHARILVIAALLMAGASRGETVTYALAGTVNTVFGVPFNGISPDPGDPIVGTLAYDPSVSTLTPGTYDQQSPNHLSLLLRGVSFESDQSYSIRIENNAGGGSFGYDAVTFYDYSPGFPGSIPGYSSIYIEFADFSSSVFSGLGLPPALNLADFNSQSCEITTVSAGYFSGVTFTVTALTAVPEPAPALLLIIGMLLVAPLQRSIRNSKAQSRVNTTLEIKAAPR